MLPRLQKIAPFPDGDTASLDGSGVQVAVYQFEEFRGGPGIAAVSRLEKRLFGAEFK